MRDVTVVLLYEIVVCPVNGALFGLAFGKQLDKRRAERRHYVLESGYGRAGDVVFKLRDISLCQLATVAELFLRQVGFESQFPDFRTDFH